MFEPWTGAAIRVALSRRGRALVGRLAPAARRSQQGFLQTLSAAEQKTLVALLQRVLEANDATRLAPKRPT